jgi:hypothetical protein
MSFTSLLTQRCIIQRKTTTVNEYKHTVNTWSDIATDVACRIDYMFVTSSYLSQTPNAQIAGNDYIGFFNRNQDIQMGDRIYWMNIYLYARPINYTFASSSTTHHLEVMFGLQET